MFAVVLLVVAFPLAIELLQRFSTHRLDFSGKGYYTGK